MAKAILCVGKSAEIPYFFEKTGVNIYSVEELCYLLIQEAFLLDHYVMNKKLVLWLKEECGLEELSHRLYGVINHKGTVSEFVTTVLQYTGYADGRTIQKVEKTIEQNAELTDYEKQKTRIDYMVQNGRYAMALCEYDRLLDEVPLLENSTIARIEHNKGVVLCRLFLYRQAAELFERSYARMPLEATYIHYLAAKRMELGEEEYVSFVAGLPENYEASLLLEQQVNDARQQWEVSLAKEKTDRLEEWKRDGRMNEYYEEMEDIVRELQETYRLHAAE